MRTIVVALALLFAATVAPASAVPRAGDPAPAMVLPAVDGRPFSLAALRGKAVYLNFFATWCGPCRVETPAIVALSKRFAPDGLRVVGIDVGEDAARARGFGAEFAIPYRLLADVDSRTRPTYGGGLFFPLHVFIDRTGIVRTYHPGEMSGAEIERAVRGILTGTEKSSHG
jgi:cytochrome c biogenesis protein CcmG/thiol:disulfide interchange protein DsbE